MTSALELTGKLASSSDLMNTHAHENDNGGKPPASKLSIQIS